MWNHNAYNDLVMELNLERPLLFFDIESTGLNIASDAIIELSFVKILPGSEQRIKTWRVKPWDYANGRQKAINPAAQAVHGISDADLADCPTLRLSSVINKLQREDNIIPHTFPHSPIKYLEFTKT